MTGSPVHQPANNRFNPEVAALLRDNHPAELALEVLRLKAALECTGEAANICVASDIRRTCRYCMCGGWKEAAA